MKLEDYEKEVTGRECVMCNHPLPGKVEYYNHDRGWEVEGFPKRQWLYVTCPECGYENALQKLGFSRDP